MALIRHNDTWLPNIFNDFFDNDWTVRRSATAPAINVIEHEDDYVVELAVPGLSKENFKVDVDQNDNLVITMEKKEENKESKRPERYLRREFSYTKFQQTLILPDDVEKDKISAHVEHGVLHVELPKRKPEVRPTVSRSIEVK